MIVLPLQFITIYKFGITPLFLSNQNYKCNVINDEVVVILSFVADYFGRNTEWCSSLAEGRSVAR